MNNGYVIYNDDSVKLKVLDVVAKVGLKDPICTISKKKLENIVSFVSDVKIDCSDGFKINDFKFEGNVIKSRENVLNSEDKYKFDVKKSYIATIDKKTANDVVKFYDIVKSVVEKNDENVDEKKPKENKVEDIFDVKTDDNVEDKAENVDEPKTEIIEENKIEEKVDDKIVFDASKETSLQGAFNMQFVNPNEGKEEVIDKNKEEKKETEDNSSDTEGKKKGGYRIFVVCIIASFVLTVMAILIATKIISV